MAVHDAWLQRERLLDEVGSKKEQWVLASDVGLWLQADIEARHCCEMQAAVQQFNYAGTQETRLQGGKMQGSSGSTETGMIFVVCLCVSLCTLGDHQNEEWE